MKLVQRGSEVVGVLNWLDVGVVPPRRVRHELDGVRDAGTSYTFPGFVTPTRLPNCYEVPETSAGSADVHLKKRPSKSANEADVLGDRFGELVEDCERFAGVHPEQKKALGLQANVCVERRVRWCVSLRDCSARGVLRGVLCGIAQLGGISLCGIAQLGMFSRVCVFQSHPVGRSSAWTVTSLSSSLASKPRYRVWSPKSTTAFPCSSCRDLTSS